MKVFLERSLSEKDSFVQENDFERRKPPETENSPDALRSPLGLGPRTTIFIELEKPTLCSNYYLLEIRRGGQLEPVEDGSTEASRCSVFSSLPFAVLMVGS